ncbi:MAG: alkane 1-monooxygenase [Burkholderiaceae bacterium]|nr:alkane 1-monooxygenase [Burkholderiaceae bacterium]
MLATVLGVLFLAAFTLLPLHWVAIGAPWASIAVAFVAIPLVDAWVGAPRRVLAERRPIPFVRWIPRLQLPLQATLLIGAVGAAPDLALGELLVFALAVGTVTGGMGITIAHELGHRSSRLDRAVAKALLVSVMYGHFLVEHVRGHHVRVATPDDPATAPRGMTVYRFIPRSVVGSFTHAWRLERMRLARLQRPAWHPSNWVLTGSVLSLVLLVAAAAAAGPHGALLFAIQSVWAFVLLEIINYVEHYGLQRRRVDGRYEPVREEHSWNADFAVSNWVLFNLQLHSDHHAHMNRPFEDLRTVPDAPQLPAGYPAMVLLALVPPLWFSVMDRRLPAAA